MSFPLQPLSFVPMSFSTEANGLPIASLQKALSLQPSLASKAASETMMGPTSFSHLTSIPESDNLGPLTGGKTHSDDQLKQAAKSFESIFLRMIFKEMRSSVQKSSVMGNSRAMEFFETMRDEQLSEQLASSGGLGIGRIVYDKLKEATGPHLKTFS